jgi:hypothetical protein
MRRPKSGSGLADNDLPSRNPAPLVRLDVVFLDRRLIASSALVARTVPM